MSLSAVVQYAADIPPEAKGQIISLLQNLSPSARQDLVSMLRTTTDAGVGAVILTFLAGQGLLPALLGAAAGVALPRRPQYLSSYSTFSSPFL